jgi:hypothetical protein
MTKEKAPGSPSLWVRAAWTVLPVAVALVAGWVLLPDVEGALGESARSASVVALGVMPFVSASFLVELVALVVPRWAVLRHGGPAGRRKLGRAAAVLAMVLAVLQGYGVARVDAELFGGASVLRTTVTLAAGSAGLFLLAEAATSRGLASGLGVLVVTGSIGGAVQHLLDPAHGLRSVDLWAQLPLVAGTALATWYALERRDKAAPGAWVPVPASGVAPLYAAASLFAMGSILGTWSRDLLRASSPGTRPAMASLAILLATGALTAWLFNLPSRIAAVSAGAVPREIPPAQHLARARAALRVATVETLIFLVVLFALDQVAARFSRFAVGPATIALATALAIDLAAELRARRAFPDLVPVWPEHRPYALPAARALLEAAGIPLFARGERLRRLLQWGAPYVPIDLMVPQQHAKRARRILDRLLRARVDGEQDEGDTEEDRLPEPPPAPPAKPVRVGPRLAVLAVLAAAVVLGQPALWWVPARPPPGPRTTTLELLLVDDEDELFDDVRAMRVDELPRGVSLMVETAPLGGRGTLPRWYARIMQGETESLDEAGKRLLAWVEARARPQGVRVAVGELTEYDPEKERNEVIGWRTYLVKGPPVVTAADVVDAAAFPPGRGPAAESPRVELRLSPEGAKRFEDFTAANVKRRLAILVDGRVASAPVIMSRIAGGTVQITMGTGDPEQQLAEAEKLVRGLLGR